MARKYSDPFSNDPASSDFEGDLAVEREKKTKKPDRFKVVVHNDDFTTTEFVVDVLIRHFHKQPPEATQIMLQVHTKGKGVAGVYPRDQAETKISEVSAEARREGMPLLLTMERE